MERHIQGRIGRARDREYAIDGWIEAVEIDAKARRRSSSPSASIRCARVRAASAVRSDSANAVDAFSVGARMGGINICRATGRPIW
jgi:hypothetical protein